MVQLVQLDHLLELPQTQQLTIPESYLDVMGHMNIAWYTHLFSAATGELFELFDMGRGYMEGSNAGSFALESHVRYLSEVRVGQRVTVRSRLLGRSLKRFYVIHFMIRNGDKLAAINELVVAHIDMSSRRMSPFPATVEAGLDRLLAEHQALSWPAPVCGVMKP